MGGRAKLQLLPSASIATSAAPQVIRPQMLTGAPGTAVLKGFVFIVFCPVSLSLEKSCIKLRWW